MRVYLSLGSNIDPEKNLRAALRALRERFGVLQISSVYESAAVGFDGPPFWNLAVGINSDLDAEELNAWLHALEDAHGRDRAQPRYADRTLDIDIIAMNGVANDRPELQHAFVLAPLADIARNVIDPRSRETIGESWMRLRVSSPEEIKPLQKLAIDLCD